jgi:ribosome-associated protein
MMASDDALTRWMAKHPASDLQHLRSLIRAARKDAAAKELPGAAPRKSRSFRDLFQFIKQATGAAEAEGAAGDE